MSWMTMCTRVILFRAGADIVFGKPIISIDRLLCCSNYNMRLTVAVEFVFSEGRHTNKMDHEALMKPFPIVLAPFCVEVSTATGNF